MEFKEVLNKMQDTYTRKNTDYGDSFKLSLDEHGLIASIIQMEHKFNSLKNLLKNKQQVEDESIADTLLDLANYSAMTYMWLNSKDNIKPKDDTEKEKLQEENNALKSKVAELEKEIEKQQNCTNNNNLNNDAGYIHLDKIDLLQLIETKWGKEDELYKEIDNNYSDIVKAEIEGVRPTGDEPVDEIGLFFPDTELGAIFYKEEIDKLIK